MADEIELPELDRLLRQELSIEPSGTFLPAVRDRIERERPRASALDRLASVGSWRLPRWQLTMGLAVLVLATGTVHLLRAPRSQEVTPGPLVTNAAAALDPVTPRPQDPGHSEVSALTERLAQARSRRAAERRPQPSAPTVEVIVDPGHRAAISHVLELVNSGRLTEASFVASRPGELPLVEEVTTTPIVVEPVAVSPFVSGGVLQKGIERN